MTMKAIRKVICNVLSSVNQKFSHVYRGAEKGHKLVFEYNTKLGLYQSLNVDMYASFTGTK